MKFFEVKYALAVEKFRDLRQRLFQTAHPDETGLRELEALAAAVRECDEKVIEAREKYAPHLPGYTSIAMRRMQEQQAAQIANFRERVNAVEI